MSLRRIAAAALVAATLSWTPLVAQRRQPTSVLALDLDVVGGGLSYARARGQGGYVGLGAGVGGAFWNRMLLAGRHFSDEGGPSYQARDGATDKDLIEILHAEVFRRWVTDGRWSFDAGVRGSVMIHFDSSDDDPGVPLFVGAYGSALWGGRRFRVGPRLLVGLFTEGALAREFGVYLVPVSGRVTFGW